MGSSVAVNETVDSLFSVLRLALWSRYSGVMQTEDGTRIEDLGRTFPAGAFIDVKVWRNSSVRQKPQTGQCLY